MHVTLKDKPGHTKVNCINKLRGKYMEHLIRIEFTNHKKHQI